MGFFAPDPSLQALPAEPHACVLLPISDLQLGFRSLAGLGVLGGRSLCSGAVPLSFHRRIPNSATGQIGEREALSPPSHPIPSHPIPSSSEVLPRGAQEAPGAGSFPRCGRPCPGRDGAHPVRLLSVPGLGCRRGTFPAAAVPPRREEAVSSLAPGAMARSTPTASSCAGLAAFLQRAGTLPPRKPCPDLCRTACFPLTPAPFRPRCSSSKAALGSVLSRNPNLASVRTG